MKNALKNYWKNFGNSLSLFVVFGLDEISQNRCKFLHSSNDNNALSLSLSKLTLNYFSSILLIEVVTFPSVLFCYSLTICICEYADTMSDSK
jgi:hypothetical protein